MRFDLITIFPEFFQGPFEFGIIRRAVQNGIVKINIHDLRHFTHDKHQVVDDRPFGGGDGMVLKPEPIFRAVEWLKEVVKSQRSATVLLTPQGRRFDQEIAAELAEFDHVILLCGRYEGIDERVIETLVTDEISIGDYVLSGGELPAMVLVDAVVRLLPNALGSDTSAANDSFSSGLLDCPHYTRPAEYRGLTVPEVLQEGNHKQIAAWRRRKALEKTLRQRPDLLESADLTEEDKATIRDLLRNRKDKSQS
ncbi:MAG TPA: tRNA (guanosine(37)-N1)-methyltransferase TrmD [Blastocatellia bacterium]|nr:tRNA (guanosine(37)-N1)-methyltransferase TrmD [Blastocatellia bacterium]